MQIFVYGEIETATAKTFAETLAAHPRQAMTIRVNSPGGDASAGLAMANALKAHVGPTTVQIEGLCASAATLLACVTHTRMAENSLAMIHHPWSARGGNSKDLRETAAVLDKLTVNVVNMYAAKTGKSVGEIQGILDAGERWFNAPEALAFGLVDEITQELKIAACVGLLTIPPRFKMPMTDRLPADELQKLNARALDVYRQSWGLRQRFKTPEAFVQRCVATVVNRA
ncbi:MAG TPA: Clp protease ClpP [Candidatus Competibacter sp.]|nr:Clp protease ClpP [Candidatus Competibacteraceae bacterium]HPE71897.1 Clp protease ClpP [Candidatus Competibacter sp.]HRW66113.1 Clp protease ClpP [Candidatus Competibacter sp.]